MNAIRTTPCSTFCCLLILGAWGVLAVLGGGEEDKNIGGWALDVVAAAELDGASESDSALNFVDSSEAVAPALPERGLCAHRGGGRIAPENTLSAFRAAGDSPNVAQIELDVRVARDGALIVMHDSTVDRTTDGTGAVADLTLAEIKRLDAGVKFGDAFRGTRVPTFAEALDVIPRDVWINAHYYGADDFIPAVVATIVERGRLRQTFLAASQEQIQIARSVEPTIFACNMSRQGKDSAAYVARTIELKHEFIQLLKGVYTQDDIARLKAAGVRINCFGTNDPRELEQMKKDGIDFPLVDDFASLDFGETRRAQNETETKSERTLTSQNETETKSERTLTSQRKTETKTKSDAIDAQIDRAWDAAWTKFYSPQTRLFYDFIESFEPGRELAHLPTEDEVARQFPNECGYGTAMEDCAISGGVILTALVDRFDTTGDETLRSKARDVFEGLELLTTVSGSPGFVARGVSPKALDRCYINSSRDQVTHLALAVWEYWRSPLSDDETRPRAAAILYAIADRMTRNVVPENDFDFLCADGSRCRRGICKMANVEEHEAARLPAIYAVAWDVAKRSDDVEKENEYWTRWRRWEKEGVERSQEMRVNANLQKRVATYALLQMQESLDVLWRLESDSELKQTLAETLAFVSALAKSRQNRALQTLKSLDLTEIAPSWREAGGLVGEYRKIWYAPRECGEIALTAASDSANSESFDESTASVLAEALETPNFERISTCGVFHLIGAYEKARRRGFFAPTTPN